jgi:hypothetical protein
MQPNLTEFNTLQVVVGLLEWYRYILDCSVGPRNTKDDRFLALRQCDYDIGFTIRIYAGTTRIYAACLDLYKAFSLTVNKIMALHLYYSITPHLLPNVKFQPIKAKSPNSCRRNSNEWVRPPVLLIDVLILLK